MVNVYRQLGSKIGGGAKLNFSGDIFQGKLPLQQFHKKRGNSSGGIYLFRGGIIGRAHFYSTVYELKYVHSYCIIPECGEGDGWLSGLTLKPLGILQEEIAGDQPVLDNDINAELRCYEVIILFVAGFKVAQNSHPVSLGQDNGRGRSTNEKRAAA